MGNQGKMEQLKSEALHLLDNKRCNVIILFYNTINMRDRAISQFPWTKKGLDS